jgi:hypothetical protein
MSLEDTLFNAHHLGLWQEVMNKLGTQKYKQMKMETGPKTDMAFSEVLKEAAQRGALETLNWESALIKSTTYNFEAETLFVEFPNETTYSYTGISLNEYNEFKAAESKGKYFSSNIRNKKEYSKNA